MYKLLIPFFKNFYFITGIIFLLWVSFLDSNDLVSRFKTSQRLRTLNQQKAYYRLKIQEVQKDREELLNNDELLEKYAREKYLMKQKTEDIFILHDE